MNNPDDLGDATYDLHGCATLEVMPAQKVWSVIVMDDIRYEKIYDFRLVRLLIAGS